MGCKSSKATAVAEQFDTPKKGYLSPRSATETAVLKTPPPPPSTKLVSPPAPPLDTPAANGPVGTVTHQTSGTLRVDEAPQLSLPPISAVEPGVVAVMTSPITTDGTPDNAAFSMPYQAPVTNVDADGVHVELPPGGKPLLEEQVVTGLLEKRGAPGTAGANSWKRRYVLLSAGKFMYYKTEKDYIAQKPPINQVDLCKYAVMKGERSPSQHVDAQRSFHLVPMPDASHAGLEGGVEERVWELRAVKLDDLDPWIECFIENGAHSVFEYEAALARQMETATLASGPPAVSEAQIAVQLAKAIQERPSLIPTFAPSTIAAFTHSNVREEGMYDASRIAISPEIMADLMDPITDGTDQYSYAGYLDKRGEGHYAGYKKRWVVVKKGFLMYYDSESSRKRDAKPNHENFIPLSAYQVVVPNRPQELRLEPIDKGKVGDRVWDFRVISTHESDRSFWEKKLRQHGARGNVATTGISAVTALARAMPASVQTPGSTNVADATSTAIAPAANGYDFTQATGIWEMCTTPEGLLYWYHVPTGVSQWTKPTSDYLEGAEPRAPAHAPAPAPAPAPHLAHTATVPAVSATTAPAPPVTAATLPTPTPAPAPAPIAPAKQTTAAATDAINAALTGVTAARVGVLERYHQPKGVRPGGFRKHFIEIKGGQLCSYENEKAYSDGVSVKPGHALQLNKYVLMEALAIFGVGPDATQLLDKADAGKTLTLQAVNPKTQNPAIWQLRCANNTQRQEWGLSIMAAGANRPALPDELPAK